MTLRNQENSQTSSFKEWSWKWEKRHWLIVISIACLALWWFGSSFKESPWLTKLTSYLPLIGSACFAAEAIVKLSR